LLPAIKRGTADMIALREATVGNSDAATRAMASVSDYWSLFWANFKSTAYEALGLSIAWHEKILQGTVGVLATAALAKASPENAAHLLNKLTIGSTDEEKMKFAQAAARKMSNEDSKKFLDEFKKILGEGGTKLNPFGLQSAQGASSLQQMGGGDIVSAIAFTPLERIANATEETAANTKPENRGIVEEIVRLPLTVLGL
jgi:hypothetical protein